ncbi:MULTISPECIES: CBS domain-containing protein [Aromatoleum]|uniref:CBS domain-containing protein n=2 Tax=Aromatoleum TaxID=551759 RepID=A0ABX1NVC0_9RHOO|nr:MULTISPECIES: CBS domain-containing protein [Aromatoleum]MCK0507845.1 CBS domain-containing protein [Aromatoleum anaerobium]NMG15964.1 CBS domain-containing protein [Aromatoleum bremense]QTQ33714.1 CBS domain-containing protein [Aromatoleum bremense]
MPRRRIRDVIEHQSILTAPRDISVREATRRMAQAGVGAIMITDAERLVGIFTERDALVRVLAAGLDAESVRLDQVMTASPQTAMPDIPLGHALHMMYDGGFRHIPIVDNGRPIGMVSARDALGQELVAFEVELERRDAITDLL